jgi:hypothetical protein
LKEVVTFSCPGVTDSELLGESENVSNTGILFRTEAEVKVGSAIRLDLHVHSELDVNRMVRLHAEGIVVRAEAGEEWNRVAAEIRFEEREDGTGVPFQ